jgi:hypothetical protein
MPHTPAVAEALLWVARSLLIYGFALGLMFLVSWWPKVDPRDRWSLPVLDVGGWVAAFVLVYAIILANVIFWPTPSHDPDITTTRTFLVVFLVTIDAAITIRALHWRRIRRNTGDGSFHRRKTDIMENPL